MIWCRIDWWVCRRIIRHGPADEEPRITEVNFEGVYEEPEEAELRFRTDNMTAWSLFEGDGEGPGRDGRPLFENKEVGVYTTASVDDNIWPRSQ